MGKHFEGGILKATKSEKGLGISNGMEVIVSFSEPDTYQECLKGIGRGTKRVSAADFIGWAKTA